MTKAYEVYTFPSTSIYSVMKSMFLQLSNLNQFVFLKGTLSLLPKSFWSFFV